MYAEERQQAIGTMVSQRGRMSVAALSETFGVTTETVRRDLAFLERIGQVRRVHGGAVPTASLHATEPGMAERDQTRAEQKDRIARCALSYLPPNGGSALFDAGTTTGRMITEIPTDLDFTAITNSVPIGARLASMNSVSLILVGGRVRGVTQAAVGEDALRLLGTLRVDVAFIGTNAISLGHGLSTPDSEEAAVKRALVKAANHVVVLADSSKVGREHLISFAPLSSIDVLITDEDITPTDTSEFHDQGIEVVIA
ncbi:UNVERIFIED_ORG: DeoR family transcriptional regulator [Nocardia globerula]|uniref:Lactose phosphotransferase system repressor n=1 Tax=Nocardia globerula TaxID=1818 RepID=A0A652YKA6_NOCGL|nr:DeoR/GlpR family DNA-binding transcription regulator [Rhodococcus globerulus]NMD61862.1 DeoR/GlpR transcriptional regulator [Nocardia globerula]PVX66058.1 DeoR family transcriptional regulator [Rhodococcus globerulus]